MKLKGRTARKGAALSMLHGFLQKLSNQASYQQPLQHGLGATNIWINLRRTKITLNRCTKALNRPPPKHFKLPLTHNHNLTWRILKAHMRDPSDKESRTRIWAQRRLSGALVFWVLGRVCDCAVRPDEMCSRRRHKKAPDPEACSPEFESVRLTQAQATA